MWYTPILDTFFKVYLTDAEKLLKLSRYSNPDPSAYKDLVLITFPGIYAVSTLSFLPNI
jgi:hypothetical protein